MGVGEDTHLALPAAAPWPAPPPPGYLVLPPLCQVDSGWAQRGICPSLPSWLCPLGKGCSLSPFPNLLLLSQAEHPREAAIAPDSVLARLLMQQRFYKFSPPSTHGGPPFCARQRGTRGFSVKPKPRPFSQLPVSRDSRLRGRVCGT